GGMRRFSKALEMIEPVLAAAKPFQKFLGPIGIVLGVLVTASEAHAAAAAPTTEDAAVHALDTVKEGFYLAGMRKPEFLIPALAMSATEIVDKKVGVTSTAARQGI